MFGKQRLDSENLVRGRGRGRVRVRVMVRVRVGPGSGCGAPLSRTTQSHLVLGFLEVKTVNLLMTWG